MVRENQSGRKGKGLMRKGFAEKPSFAFRMKTEPVREEASGDEDGEFHSELKTWLFSKSFPP